MLMVMVYREQWYLWLIVDVLAMIMWLRAENYCMAAQYGVTAIVQPGGSVRDEDSIKKANECGITMLCTGMRHFKH